MKRWPAGAHCILTILITIETAFACTCEPPPLCTRIARSDFIFAGQVVATTESGGVFIVDERFKGISEGQKNFVGSIDHMCEYVALVVGRHYLVFGQQIGENAWIGPCHGTREIERAAEEVGYLRL